MRHLTRILPLMLAAVMLIAAAVPVYADTIIDYVLYTDIRTYIDGVEITSYNIKGYTAVVVEDLASYGFDVTWNASARTLTAKRSVGKAVTGSAVSSTSGGAVGTRAMPVYSTDIRTYFDGVEFKSYNVGGRTIVYVDDLANMYSNDYQWNSGAKTLRMGLATTFTAPPVKLMDTGVLYDGGNMKIYDLSSGKSFTLGSTTYYEGFTLLSAQGYRGSGYGYALFDLAGNYSKLSFTVGKAANNSYRSDYVTLQVFLDGNISEEIILYVDSPSVNVEIDLKHANGLKLVLKDNGMLSGANITFGFANCLLYP